MAKGNMMQGMARGKVGDVVFSRLNGQQVSRVRNRNPRDAKSNAQLYQRAIMATVMQAYSAGKQIFDHSFQGKSVGASNQAYFMAQNLKLLRANLSNAIDTELAPEHSNVNCVWPSSKFPVPNGYLISEGKYQQKAWNESMGQSGAQFALPAAQNNEKVNEYAARVGLIPDDYYTFVAFVVGTQKVYTYPVPIVGFNAAGFDCHFGFVRLQVKSNIKSIEETMELKSQLFDVDATSNMVADFIYEAPEEHVKLYDLDSTSRGVGSVGLIRSRKDSDLRSTSKMYCPTESQFADQKFGLKPNYVLGAWRAWTESLGDSDLILEGGSNA